MVQSNTTQVITETAEQKLARLMAENEKLRADLDASKKSRGSLTLKVSEKGAISIYGLGKFPCTLYKEQMERVLDHADKIREFMKSNEKELKVKGS